MAITEMSEGVKMLKVGNSFKMLRQFIKHPQ